MDNQNSFGWRTEAGGKHASMRLQNQDQPSYSEDSNGLRSFHGQTAVNRNYGGVDRTMAAQNHHFSNPVDSEEWIASMERENHYMARQIVRLEEDKKRLTNELQSVSAGKQSNVVKLSDYEKVTNSLQTLEEKSTKLEEQLLKAKDYIDRLSESTANDEQLIQQNEALQHQLEEGKANQTQTQEALTALQIEHETLEQELTQLREKAQSSITREEYAELVQDKQALKAKQNGLVSENDSLNNQLTDLTAEKMNLQNQIGKLKIDKQTADNRIDDLETEKKKFQEKIEANESEVEELKIELTHNNTEVQELRSRLATKSTELEEASSKLGELEEKSYDLIQSQENITRLNRTIEKLQRELTEEKGKHLVDPKTSPEYVSILEENIRLRSADPKKNAVYLELLTEKNTYEQKYKAYNPKASKEYLELLVITERQRAQIAEMIANKEMVRITQDEIADILSEAQQKARKIVQHAEERAETLISDTDFKMSRKQNSLKYYDENVRNLISESVEVFKKVSDQADKLDDELTVIPVQ